VIAKPDAPEYRQRKISTAIVHVEDEGTIMSQTAINKDDAIFTRISWHILPLLMLAWLFAFIDRVNIGFAKLQMATDLGFSDAVYGFGAGIFFLGYFLFEIPSNLILHKVGARRWIGRIMITWSVFAGLTAFVRTPMQFYWLRFLLGLAEAGFIPGAVYYISLWFPSTRRGKVFGIFFLALAGAGLVGGPLSGAVLAWMSGWLGLAGWKWLLLIEALLSLIIGVLVVLFLPERPETAGWLDADGRAHVIAAIAADRKQHATLPAADIWRNPTIYLLVIIYFLANYAGYGLSFWLPTLVQGFGVTGALSIGLLSGLPSLCCMISMVLFGLSADRHNERRWHLTAMLLIGAVGFVVTVVAGRSLFSGMIGLCMAAICTQAMPSLFWAVPTRLLSGVSAAAGLALINALGNLAGFFGPYVVGLLRQTQWGTPAAIYSLAFALFASAALVHALPGRLIDRPRA
jgi:MFS family permease